MNRSIAICAVGVAVAAVCVVFLLRPPAVTAQPPKRSITGLVLDKAKTPIPGAKVYLVETGGGGGTTLDADTDATGKYEFKNVAYATPFDVVFSHTNYEAALVSRLAPAGNQVIHKTLYKPGQKKMAVSDVLDRVSTLERFLYYRQVFPEDASMTTRALREVMNKELREKPNPKMLMAADTDDFYRLPAASQKRLSNLVEARVSGLSGVWAP